MEEEVFLKIFFIYFRYYILYFKISFINNKFRDVINRK